MKTSYPPSHMLGWAPYIPASSHSSTEEFRARQRRRLEDAQRQRAERERNEAHERYEDQA